MSEGELKISSSQWEDVEVEVHEGLAVGIVVSVRFTPEEAEHLRDLAEKSEMSLTQLIKAAVEEYR